MRQNKAPECCLRSTSLISWYRWRTRGSRTKFTYLGSEVSSTGYCTPDIHRRIGLAYSNMGKLDRVWNNSRLSLATKLRIYNCCILAVFLCGSETWTLLKRDSQALQACHMRCQRRILGKSWTNRVYTAEVSSLCLCMFSFVYRSLYVLNIFYSP